MTHVEYLKAYSKGNARLATIADYTRNLEELVQQYVAHHYDMIPPKYHGVLDDLLENGK